MMRAHSSRPRRAGILLLVGLAMPLALPGNAWGAVLGNPGSPSLPSVLAREGSDRVVRQGNRVLVDVRFDGGAIASLAGLRGAGATVIAASRRYQTVTAAVKPEDLAGVEAAAGDASVTLVRPPIVAGVGSSAPVASAVEPCFGAATSEGDLQLKAMAARDGFAVNGSGVKVGVLSDSFDQDAAADTDAAQDVASGDLPGPANPCGFTTPVQVLDDSFTNGEDEGRAMAQIVHDLAPGASISFASAFGSEISFAENITELAKAGASVIVDDVFYPEEPFFQDGPVAVAVEKAVAEGVTYLSAAGNDNLIDSSGRDIASWEAPAFRDSHTCPSSVVALSEAIEEDEGPGSGLHPDHCMDFDPGAGSDTTFGIAVSKGATLLADLQWAEPRDGVSSDLDAFLLDSNGKVIELSARDNASPRLMEGTQEPFEEVEWKNNTGSAAVVRLVINRYSGSKVTPLKFALLQNGGGVTATEYPESSGGDVVGPTVFGHSGSASAIGVAAAPFFSDEEPEYYSSRGPVTHYFGPVEGTTAAAPLSIPEEIPKPDVTATDGGANTFFGRCEAHAWRFYGTSAAAPHAAAVAALELQAEPAASAAEVREALVDSASPIGSFPPEAVGSGLVDAPEALAAITSTPFPGGSESAQPVPQNCGLTKASSGSTPVSPSPPSSNPVTAAPEPRAPHTFFLQRPSRVIRTSHASAKAVFRFGSNQSAVHFVCRIDGGLFRPCPVRLARRFPLGWHLLEVAARDAQGIGDPTPARYRFKVKRAR